MSNWSIIVPEAGKNYALNPIAGTTGNYADVAGGVTTIVTTYSYLGNACYNHVFTNDNDGVTFTMLALPNAIAYVSLRVHESMAGWDWSLDGANFTAPTLLGQEGDWYVYGAAFVAAQANGSTGLRVYQNGAVAITFHTGHFQVESGIAYATTPITGDLRGTAGGGYKWLGAPHASASTRSAQERSGGRVRDLNTYLVDVKFSDGISLAPRQHLVQPLALLPGALYAGEKVYPLSVELTFGPTSTMTPAQIHSMRKDLIDLIKSDLVKRQQPFILRYTGALSTNPVDIPLRYQSGLEFYNRQPVEQFTATCVNYDSYVYGIGEEANTLTTSLTVADADYCCKKIDGTWSNISTEFNGSVYAMVKGNDGCIYIGGNFTDVGDANGDYIVKYDPNTGTLTSLGTGLSAVCHTLAVAPNGDIYAGGEFLSAGGVANTVRVAYWDVSAGVWMPLLTGIGNTVLSLCFDQSGNLYAGGAFTNHVDGDGDYITKWNGAAWASVTTDELTGGIVRTIAVAPNGDIYVGGEFTASAGGTTLGCIAKLDGSTWVSLADGVTTGTLISSIAIDNAGNVYAGGNFSVIGGVTTNDIAVWNGVSWSELAGGTTDEYVARITISASGLVYVGGGFTGIGGISTADRVAIWNGSTWAHIDSNLPGAAYVTAVLLDGDDLYLGYSTSGSATTSYLNTVTNSGTASAYPKLVFKREGGTSAVVEWVRNETTGDTLWLNYSLLDGETLTIDCSPTSRSVVSSFFGSVMRALLRNSDFGSFTLLPGANSLSCFINNTGATITAYEIHTPTYHGVDGAAA